MKPGQDQDVDEMFVDEPGVCDTEDMVIKDLLSKIQPIPTPKAGYNEVPTNERFLHANFMNDFGDIFDDEDYE